MINTATKAPAEAIRTAEQIKKLKIQGAEQIAIAAITTILQITKKSKDNKKLKQELLMSKQVLESARPTEPAMRNALKYICGGLESEQNLENSKTNVINKSEELIELEKQWRDKISECGASIIRNNQGVYTHCHSTDVVNILIRAKQQEKKFEVNNTETRPLYQGRITAIQLNKEKILVKHHIDSAMQNAIKNSDIILLGCDAINDKGAYNKIGSGIIAILAKKHKKPVFICAASWKYSSSPITIEHRNPKEIWANSPKEIHIYNPAFEFIEKENINGVVSEFGILKFNAFIRKAKQKWK